jgi:hypothetical protein
MMDVQVPVPGNVTNETNQGVGVRFSEGLERAVKAGHFLSVAPGRALARKPLSGRWCPEVTVDSMTGWDLRIDAQRRGSAGRRSQRRFRAAANAWQSEPRFSTAISKRDFQFDINFFL